MSELEEAARVRVVFTRDQAKLLKRCVEQVFAQHEMKFALRCTLPGCPDPHMTQIEDGPRLIWRCGHADRVMETSY